MTETITLINVFCKMGNRYKNSKKKGIPDARQKIGCPE